MAKKKPKSAPTRKQSSSGAAVAATVVTPAPPIVEGPPKKLLFVLCALLMAATFLVYYRALGNPFVNYDDPGYVSENAHVQQGLTRDAVRWAFTAMEADNWHPLTWLSHELDCELYGLEPAGHHFSSVLLHVFNTGILFLLLAIVTGKPWPSFTVGALFGLHPINVESVAWISERKNVLSMFFCLLAIAAYGWYARRPNGQRYVLVAALFALGLMAKPMIVTLPFALMLLDFWPLQRLQSQQPSVTFPVTRFPLRRLILEKLPLLLLSIGSSVMTMVAQQGAIAPNQSLAFLARVLNSIYAYSAYVTKAFWPTHLASFYPYEGMRIGGWLFVFSLAVLVGASYWVWRERERLYVAIGWLWFIGTLVPMIGIVQVGNQAMADRYAYLSLIGIFLIVVWRVADLIEERNIALRPVAISALVVVFCLSLLTWRQIGVWRSSFDLWSHALDVTRDNFMAEDYVGSAILLDNYQKTGQRYSEAALVHFKNAVRINPEDPISHLNLGADLHEHGQLQEAIEQYQQVLNLTSDEHLVTKAYVDLGAANHQLGNFSEARQYYREALKRDPSNRVVFENMGKLGMDERIHQLAASASAHPTPEAYLLLGQLQQAASHLPEARASFETALKIKPDFPEAKAALDSIRN